MTTKEAKNILNAKTQSEYLELERPSYLGRDDKNKPPTVEEWEESFKKSYPNGRLYFLELSESYDVWMDENTKEVHIFAKYADWGFDDTLTTKTIEALYVLTR